MVTLLSFAPKGGKLPAWPYATRSFNSVTGSKLMSSVSRYPADTRGKNAVPTSRPKRELWSKRPSTSTKIFSFQARSEEHTSELQSRPHLVCRLLLEKKKYTRS